MTAVDCDVVDSVVNVESEINVTLVTLLGDSELSFNNEVLTGGLVVSV